MLEYGARILLVEDNPDHAFVAITVLHQLLGSASEVLHAETADEAINLIRDFTYLDRPDLIVVDLRLPKNGGFGVLSAVRAHAPSAQVPVFVVTSSVYDGDIALSYELGASTVLCKPLSRAKLRENWSASARWLHLDDRLPSVILSLASSNNSRGNSSLRASLQGADVTTCYEPG